MLNRLFVSVLLMGWPMGALPTVVHAQTPAAVPPTAAAAGPTSTVPAGPPPVCGLEGEIGAGRGRIEARGARQGYVGELTLPLNTPAEVPENLDVPGNLDVPENLSAAQTPRVILKVQSTFAPHKPAIDRISLEIGGLEGRADAAGSATARLSGAFGMREGRDLILTRGGEAAGSDSAWFDALLSGQTLTAEEGNRSVAITYSADQFASDYDFLLDLLQLTAGWEIRGLCVNRTPG